MDNLYIEKAVDYKHGGHNCAQAVVHALADMKGIDSDKYVEMASGFGLGMGTTENTCGALVGAIIMKGVETDGKGTMVEAKRISTNFKNLCGSLICKELKGIETGKVLCSCDDCVRNAMRSFD